MMPDRPIRTIEARRYRQLIGSELGEPTSGQRFTRESPAHDVVGGYPPDAVADTNRPVAAAPEAFANGPRPKVSSAERSRNLFRAADLIERHSDELVLTNALEGGKSITLITPWNFPSLVSNQKLPLTLVVGCARVAKQREPTPGSTLLPGELGRDIEEFNESSRFFFTKVHARGGGRRELRNEAVP